MVSSDKDCYLLRSLKQFRPGCCLIFSKLANVLLQSSHVCFYPGTMLQLLSAVETDQLFCIALKRRVTSRSVVCGARAGQLLLLQITGFSVAVNNLTQITLPRHHTHNNQPSSYHTKLSLHMTNQQVATTGGVSLQYQAFIALPQ